MSEELPAFPFKTAKEYETMDELPVEDRLHWHALNFRTAHTLEVIEAWKALEAFVEKRILAAKLEERERIVQFIETDYVRQFVRPWRDDLAAAIRGA